MPCVYVSEVVIQYTAKWLQLICRNSPPRHTCIQYCNKHTTTAKNHFFVTQRALFTPSEPSHQIHLHSDSTFEAKSGLKKGKKGLKMPTFSIFTCVCRAASLLGLRQATQAGCFLVLDARKDSSPRTPLPATNRRPKPKLTP